MVLKEKAGLRILRRKQSSSLYKAVRKKRKSIFSMLKVNVSKLSELQVTSSEELSNRKEDEGLGWTSWEGDNGESLLGQTGQLFIRINTSTDGWIKRPLEILPNHMTLWNKMYLWELSISLWHVPEMDIRWIKGWSCDEGKRDVFNS